MSVILQISYVPGSAMLAWSPEQSLEMARQMAVVPGLRWKLWTRDEAEGVWCGIYLFGAESAARVWERQAKALLARFGAIGITSQLFAVDEMQSRATRAPIPVGDNINRTVRQPEDAAHSAICGGEDYRRNPIPEC